MNVFFILKVYWLITVHYLYATGGDTKERGQIVNQVLSKEFIDRHWRQTGNRLNKTMFILTYE